jgi:hypothetical protein
MTNKSPNLSQSLEKIQEKDIKPAEEDFIGKENPVEEFNIPYVRGEVYHIII